MNVDSIVLQQFDGTNWTDVGPVQVTAVTPDGYAQWVEVVTETPPVVGVR